MAKILIVEDDTVIANLFKSAFTREGYEVELALDGLEALEKIKTIKPTMILSDIMMPRMDGIELIKHLKAKKYTKNIPIVVMSNLAKEESVNEALKAGAIKHIVKQDFGPHEVVNIVKEIIAKSSDR